MAHRFSLRKSSGVILALLAGTLLVPSAFAQGPDGPPPGGPGGPGGHGGPGGPGGPGGRGGRRPQFGGPGRPSLANTPLSALTAGLKLTSDQKAAIKQIQQNLQTQRKALMPTPGDPQSPPPDRATMQANMEKLRTLETQAVADIKKVLTADQIQALPAFTKNLETLGGAGIPVELYATLKLSDDQMTQLASIVQSFQDQMETTMDSARQSGDFASVRDTLDTLRQDTRKKVMAVLTADQQSAVTSYLKAHPRPQPAGWLRPASRWTRRLRSPSWRRPRWPWRPR